jgi:hypothetical protein
MGCWPTSLLGGGTRASSPPPLWLARYGWGSPRAAQRQRGFLLWGGARRLLRGVVERIQHSVLQDRVAVGSLQILDPEPSKHYLRPSIFSLRTVRGWGCSQFDDVSDAFSATPAGHSAGRPTPTKLVWESVTTGICSTPVACEVHGQVRANFRKLLQSFLVCSAPDGVELRDRRERRPELSFVVSTSTSSECKHRRCCDRRSKSRSGVTRGRSHWRRGQHPSCSQS